MGIIGKIRNHPKIAVTFVGIAIVAFIVGDIWSRNSGNRNDNTAAEFADVSIGLDQLSNMYEQEEARIKFYAQNPDLKFNAEMEKAIRDSLWLNLVDETVIGAEMKKLGLTVSDAEVTDMYTGTFIHPFFAQNPQFLDSTGQYNRALMASQLKAFSQMTPKNNQEALYKYSWDETKKTVTNDRLRQKYATLVYSGFYMPKAIATQIADYASKGVNVSVVSMPYDQVADSDVKLTDADYQKYYDQHKEEYRNLGEEVRMLDYVTFPITPSANDYAAAKDSAMSAWSKLMATPDSSKRLPRVVKMESMREYPYDTTYHAASYYPDLFREKVETSVEGTPIEPMPIGDKWFMGRVMGIDYRPDSIRTRVMFVFSNKLNPTFQRDSARAAFLSDSLLNELNAGTLDFDTAVANYCDVKINMTPDTLGDIKWQLEGTLDLVYNSLFEQLFGPQGQGAKGINEQIVATKEGGHFRFTLPEDLGYAIVKVTGKTAPVKKYRLATIVQKIEASDETKKEIRANASKFYSSCSNAKAFDETVKKQNMQVMTAYVQRMDDHLNNISQCREVVKWAFNENTNVGNVTLTDYNLDFVSPDNAVFGSEEYRIDAKKKDELIAVVLLKDIYQKGYFTLAQVKANPSFNFEQMVRLEKKKEMQMARAEKLAKSCKNINDVAASLNDSVIVLDSISAFANTFGRFGMEPKVQSVAAVSKGNGLIGPVKGASSVYFLQVNNRFEMQKMSPEQVEQVRLSQEYQSHNMFGGVQRGKYLPSDRMIFWWLRANAKIEDHRDKLY